MTTQEKRLGTVEYGLKQFQTETIKAYQDIAMVKGLTEDAVKRLLALRMQIDHNFAATNEQIAELRMDVTTLQLQFDHQRTALEKNNEQIASIKQDIKELQLNFEQRLTSLEDKFELVLQHLTVLTTKSRQEI